MRRRPEGRKAHCPRCGSTLTVVPGSIGRARGICPRCHRSSRPGRDEDESLAFTFGGEEEPAPLTGEVTTGEGDEEADADDWVGGPALGPEEPHLRAGNEADESMTSPLRFAVRSFLAATFSFSLLSIYLYTHPAGARSTLARLPLLGPALTEVRVPPADIVLSNVQGHAELLRGGRRAFIITGRAENNSRVPVRKIQVEGRLYGRGGQVGRQVIFSGAAVSLRRVRQLSAREVELLQRLEPPREYRIQPGDAAGFMIVFLDPPQHLSEFTVRVVSATFSRRPEG